MHDAVTRRTQPQHVEPSVTFVAVMVVTMNPADRPARLTLVGDCKLPSIDRV